MTEWPITICPTWGCWIWEGEVNERSYPVVGWRGNAGKQVYEEVNGPVPDGLVLDHLCRIRRCVSPHHREVVDQSENEKRKSWKYRCRRTHCAKGHSLADALVTPEAGRLCRTCHRENKPS